MVTKLKKSKYTKLIKISCFVLALVFSFTFAVSLFSLVRKVYYFNGENKSITNTTIFNENILGLLTYYSHLCDSSQSLSQDMTFEEFVKTNEHCKEIRKDYEQKKETALMLYKQIQKIKQLEPADDGTYYDSSTLLYYDSYGNSFDSLDEWYSERFLDWNNANINPSTPFNENEGVTVFTTQSTYTSEFFENKRYYTHAEWEKAYEDLRTKIFSIVDDATTEKTITDEINERLNIELNEWYQNAQIENLIFNSELYESNNINYYLLNKSNGHFFTSFETEEEIEKFKNTYKNNCFYYFYSDGATTKATDTKINFENTILNNILIELGILKQINYRSILSDLNIYNCELYFNIETPQNSDDVFYSIFNAFSESAKQNENLLKFSVIASLLLSIVLFSILISFSEIKEKNGKKRLYLTDRTLFIIKLPIYLLILTFSIYFLVCIVYDDILPELLILDWSQRFLLNHKLNNFVAGLLFTVMCSATIYFAYYIKRNILAKTLKERFICYKIKSKIKVCSQNIKYYLKNIKNLNKLVLIIIPAYLIILCGFLFGTFLSFVYLGLAGFIVLIPTIGIFASSIVLILKIIFDFKEINEAVEKLKNGNLDFKLEPNKYIFFLREFTENLNKCRDSIQNAVNEQLKGERLKTELITNVSHDLKTPLTSIINYVSLLKLSENIKNEDDLKYIDILDDKSIKLKRLIEDLTEASKASSGNIKMNLDIVNLNELSLQAIGENSDVLENLGLEIVLNSSDDALFIKADSQHTFRIFDNLFSNAKKYALTGTRVYVDVYKDENYGIISIKNISKEKLNINPEELTERFVRGDNSRTSEGSGLGLSIVRSFTELQNGIFTIEIDGDLFKVTVKLPLAESPQINETENL